MAIGRKDNNPGYSLVGDELKDLLAFGGEAVPSVFRAWLHFGGHGHVGAKHSESGWLLERLLEPFHLSGPEHGRVFPFG